MSRRFLLPSLVVGACCVACGGGGTDADPPHILLVTLDTTRADALGVYGAAGDPTPALDGIATAGVRFTDCRTTAPLTLPAHASLFTGAWPPKHGVRDNGDYRLPDAAVTLAERLQEAGFRTGAFVASFVLAEQFGLAQGFGTYVGPSIETEGSLRMRRLERRAAEEIADDAVEWIAAAEPARPQFLWVHFYDPHEPLDPPEPFRSRFADPYAAEVARADAAVGRILDAWESALGERTIVTAIADHGEARGEHGEETHGLLTYGATLDVPWVLKAAGRIPAGRIDRRPSSIVDVAPTLLALAGLPPDPGADGRARWPEGSDPERELYAEALLGTRSYGWSPLTSVRRGRWALVHGGYDELFDLRIDPGESEDRSRSRPETRDDLRRWLAAVADGWTTRWGDAAGDSDPETLERLRSLGYVGGGGSLDAPADAADPRDRVQVHNRFLDAQALVFEGDHATARAILEELLLEQPDNRAALRLSGSLAVQAGELATGLERLARAARATPDSFPSQLNYADALHRAGRLEEGEAVYRRALEIRPDAGEAWFGLARLRLAAGDHEAALEAFDRAEAGLGARGDLEAGRGVAFQRLGRTADAVRAFEAAVRLDPRLADAWNQLGMARERSGDDAGAREAYVSAWESPGGSAAAAFNLGRMALLAGRVADAREWVERSKDRADGYPLLLLLRAEVAGTQGDADEARSALERLRRRPDLPDSLRARAEALAARMSGT